MSIIRAYPQRITGLSVISAAAAWGYSSYVSIVDRVNNDIKLYGITFQVTNIPSLDTTQQIIFEIAVGEQGYESTIIQLPYSIRMDTAVGYYHTKTFNIVLPELFTVKTGQRLSIRAADSLTSAITYSAIRINYVAPLELVDADMINNFQYVQVGNGMSTTERWR